MNQPGQHKDEVTISELQYRIAVFEDQCAYKALFFMLFPSLQNFAFSIIKSRVVAEEIASDVLIDVWMRRKKIEDIQHLKLYLLTAVKHAAVNKLRQENKNACFSLDDLSVEFISDYGNPEASADLHAMQAQLALAVKSLPSSCQLIYKLAKEDRLKYKEIATLLNLSIKTVDNQLAIALKKIAHSLHLAPLKKNRF